MTEAEVLSKLEVFKNAIIKLKSDKESLESALEEKDKEIKKVSESRDAEIVCSEDLRKDIQALNELVQTNKDDLSEKNSTLEAKDKTIEKLKNSLSELKGYAEGKDKEIERLSNILSSNKDIVLPDNSKMEKALENLTKQFEGFNPNEEKYQLSELESKLKDAQASNDKLKEELSSKDKDLSELELSKNQEIYKTKNEYENKIKTLTDSYELELKSVKETMDNLVSENKSLRENNVGVDRVKESLKEALNAKEELVSKNQELAEKIKRLEEIIKLQNSNNPKKIVKREVPMDKENTEKKDEAQQTYRFGKTSQTIMNKVQSFLDSLYNNSQKDNTSGIITLSDSLEAKKENNLTDKEYEVFIDRLTSLDYDGSVLFWIDKDDSKLKTIADLNWVKTYISRII